MKQVLVAILLSTSVYANAFLGCENEDGAFVVSIYESDPVKVLVMDKAVSAAPLSYFCEKSTLTSHGEKLSAYGCVGGGMGTGEKKVALYVNETRGVASYQDLDDEANDKANLACHIKE